MKGVSGRGSAKKAMAPYSSQWETHNAFAATLTPEQKRTVNGVCYEREKQLQASSRCAVLMDSEMAGKGRELGMIVAEQWLL